MKVLLLITTAMMCCSCSYNVSMAHTSGTAEDVIDDTTSATPTVTTSLTPPSFASAIK